MSMLSQFLDGINYALKGLHIYLKTPRYWKYAVIPTLLVGVIYALLIAALVTRALPLLKESILNALSHPWVSWLAEPLAGIAEITAVIILLLILALCLDTLFEAVGGPFFASLVRTVEKDRFGRVPGPDTSILRDCLNTLACIAYSISTLFIAFCLFCGSIAFPVVLYLISILILGFRNAVTYVAEAGFNRNWSLPQLKRKIAPHRAALCGFGTVTFLFLTIPFVSLFVTPAFYVGATILFNEAMKDNTTRARDERKDP